MMWKGYMDNASNNRIEFIDLAKGICILLVVVVHVMPQLAENMEFLGCLRMPLYFCLSGLFYKDYESVGNFMIKKINKILIPFVAWYIIGYIIYYAGRIVVSSSSEATFHFYDILYQNEIFNLPIWFLLCLFWSNMWFTIVHRIFKVWYLQAASIFILAYMGLQLSERNILNFLYLGSSLTCLPFFYIGYIFKRTTLLYPDTDKKTDFYIMLLSLSVGALFAFIPDAPPRLNYYRNEVIYGFPLLIYLCSFSWVSGVLLLCKFLGHIPFVSWLGRYSIIVLVTHMWLRDLVMTAIKKIYAPASDDIIGIITLLLVVGLMGVIIPFCKKHLPHITAQKDLINLRYKVA